MSKRIQLLNRLTLGAARHSEKEVKPYITLATFFAKHLGQEEDDEVIVAHMVFLRNQLSLIVHSNKVLEEERQIVHKQISILNMLLEADLCGPNSLEAQEAHYRKRVNEIAEKIKDKK